MSLAFNKKEDLQMRMADLQQKLAQSEEERRKLEKTCNILMRAFKEEEKMHYKALNNKYEKFLEDCKLRQRRNDIILRSLCRVEDRARALFASTERLRALKDHYITYLKPSDLKNTEAFLLTWKTHLRASKSADGVVSKSVHWKTPHVADLFLSPKAGGVSKTEETKALKDERLEKDLAPNFESDHSRLFKSLTGRYQHSLVSYTIENQDLVQDSPEIVEEDEQRESIMSKIFHKEETTRPLFTQDKLDFNKISILTSEYFKKSSTNLSPRHINTYKEVTDNYEHCKKNFKLTPRQFSTFKEESNNYNGYVINTYDKYIGDYCNEKISRIDVLENSVNSNFVTQFNDLKKVTALKDRGVVKHQESIEKLKTALSLEDDVEVKRKENKKSSCEEISLFRPDEELNQKIIEKDEIEMNEKTKGNTSDGSEVSTFPKTDQENMHHKYAITPSSKTNLMFTSFVDRDEPENKEIESVESEKEFDSEKNEDMDQKNEFSAPLSLDGVDYQNETYPESYYEQPVHHHNYSNIASDVILEEDESE